MTTVVLNGVTYTDDANGATGMANGGHRVRFVPCLANFVIEAATQLGLQHDSRDAAHASELAAHASELAAASSAASALNSPGTTATSTSSLSLGAGAKTLAIQPGKDLVIGQFLQIAYALDPTQWMNGVITAHNPSTGALTVQVGTYKGAGTYATWVVSLSGPDALPVQTGFGGKYLYTDGVVASWITPPEFAAMRRQVFLAAGSAGAASQSAQDAAKSATSARRAAFVASGHKFQLQQLSNTVPTLASRSRAYLYGSF